jgi:hypothetical protein
MHHEGIGAAAALLELRAALIALTRGFAEGRRPRQRQHIEIEIAGLIAVIEIAAALVEAIPLIEPSILIEALIGASVLIETLQAFRIDAVLSESGDAENQDECDDGRTAIEKFTHVTPQHVTPHKLAAKTGFENRETKLDPKPDTSPWHALDWLESLPEGRNITRTKQK